jgi:Glycosyl transferase family 2/Glycosyl transferases group 1
MKVNLISNYNNQSGLQQDVLLVRAILSSVFEKDLNIFKVHFMMPQCQEADVNIFLEVVNPSLFPYAAKNIWIPNVEWTYKTWVPYLHMFNEVWAKTHETYRILSDLTPTKVRYIGWTSLDKSLPPKKNYHKAIVPVGKNIYRNPRPIFQAYMRILAKDRDLYSHLPTLHVVYDPSRQVVNVPTEIHDKVILKETLKDSEYNDLLAECGLCICTSLAEGFCHAVNEAMSAGCNLILSPIAPFKEDLVGEIQVGAIFGCILASVDQPDCLGKLVDTDVASLMLALEEYVDTEFKNKKLGTQTMRKLYEHRHETWMTNMKTILPQVLSFEKPYSLQETLPKEDELPDVSIVMLTRDRRIFMPLAKYSYMIQSYPEDKLELVVVDDGDDPIEDTLIGVPNVKYVRVDTQLSIGEKRNIGVQNAMYDVIAFMDDDDVYPNNSILHRAAMLMKEPKKECAFSATIPCYDITKYSSFMNVPPITLEMSERVSEATLIFTRKFWEERKFEHIQIAEGNTFIRGREHMCRELSPQDVIVSLVHPKNTSSRKIPEMKEPNGCHYGFNENLFAMVSQIGLEMKNA